MPVPETTLYRPVKEFLSAMGYAVKAEINGCDVVALRGDEPPLIVELKTRFSLELVLQGVDRQRLSDDVYLAVPVAGKGATFARHGRRVRNLCRRLGLGLLVVNGTRVEALLDPSPYRPRKQRHRQHRLLKEHQELVGDPNVGGAQSGRRITAYRQDALRCLSCLSTQPGLAPREVAARTGVARAATILQRNPYGWFERLARASYTLSPKGRHAETQFSHALDHLKAAHAE